MNFYKDSCPQAEEIIKEQVGLLYKRHKNTAFSWLRNIFHDCAVESCDASLLLDSTRRTLSEKEADRSFGMRNFRYLDTIKEALERSALRSSPAPTSSSSLPEKALHFPGGVPPDHNESISSILDKFNALGINTRWPHPLRQARPPPLPEVDPAINPDHIPHMLKKCPDSIPDPKAVQYVRNDRGTPMKLDNNYYRNILDNKGLLMVDHQLAYDSRTRPFVLKMAKSEDYFFQEFSRAIQILSENNPLTGTKGEVRKQCNVANKLH
ncbi:unnamed protein product [Spirodela intermedia]|uniref:Plant heme peroxidase family profile domain-containing protein n=1 Tax=Spirodela intermedia TaxID=51605 RepID=A0A7I8IJZ4_SPIIN|nr:unnamed protein product [Spirodela intermedia]CAA6658209.1 unnamed protein product [Spirodela intermedia]